MFWNATKSIYFRPEGIFIVKPQLIFSRSLNSVMLIKNKTAMYNAVIKTEFKSFKCYDEQ